MNEKKTCDLCGLDIGLNPYPLDTGERQFVFCCEGCRGIYEMLHDVGPAGTQNKTNRPT